MSLESCIRSAREWVAENADVKLNPRELETVGRFLDAAERAGATPAEKNALMSELIEQKIAGDQAKETARKYMNAIKNEQVKQQNVKNAQDWIEQGMDKNEAPLEARRAFLRGGSSRPGQGTNLDPRYLQGTTNLRYTQFHASAFTPEDFKVYQTMKMDSPLSGDVIQELNALRRGQNSMQSGNELALRIAKGIRESQDYSLTDLQAVNPYAGDNPDFLFSREHNRDKISAVQKENWIKSTRQRMAPSFLGRTDPEIHALLSDTYDDIKAGIYGSDNFNREGFWQPLGTSGNQGQATAGARSFVATDWRAEWEYAKEFGADSLYEATMTQLNRNARNVARFQKMGLNIAENYRAQDAAIYKTLDPDQKAAWVRARPEFEKLLEKTMGRQDNEAWGSRARNAQNLLAWMDLTQMGMHTPRGLNGINAAITLARDSTGRTLPENAANIIKGITEATFTKDGGREVVQKMGVVLRDVARDQNGDLAGGKQDFSLPAKTAQLMGKLTLANRQAAAFKYGLTQFTTAELGAHSHLEFEELPPQLQQRLNRANLGGDVWNVFRQGVEQDGDMKGRLIAESPYNLTNEQLEPLMKTKNPKEAARLRLEMSMNYGALLNDEAGLVAGESNSRSQFAAYGDTDVNSAWGIARRFMMQFHQSALIRQQLVERTYRSGGSSGNVSGVITHMIGGAFLSMIGEGLIAAATQKTLSPTQLLSHGINGSGALGLSGSLLASFMQQPTFNPSDAVKNAALTMVGPASATLLKGAAATVKTGVGVAQMIQGQDKEGQYGGKYWASLIHSLTPGQNLFYTKAALDYMIMNEMHQFMGNGGYLDSLRQNTAKNPGMPEFLGGDGSGQQFYGIGAKNFWE